MRILIGGPARQHEGIFKEHLESINNLILPDGCELHKYYIINDCDELTRYLDPEEYTVHNTKDEYVTNEKTHVWSSDNLSKMCILRNMMLTKCIKDGYDYVLFVDTDLVLHPETLLWLLKASKDIVAEIFWTEDEYGGMWSNCWSYDQCTYNEDDIKAWLAPGVYRVGGTGACMLVSKRIILAGANYNPIYNIHYLKGEDRYFAIRAICAGAPLYIDTHVPCTHLYRLSEYEKYMRAKDANC